MPECSGVVPDLDLPIRARQPSDIGSEAAPTPPTVGQTFRQLLSRPRELLIRRWNWKAALFSSLFRGALFFFTNLSAGLVAASGAMGAEFMYRAITAGVYGAIMQAFRKSTPRWAATAIVVFGVPAISHVIEFLVHWLRGTPNLQTSIIASFSFTALTTLYNLHMMRLGVLVVGREGGDSLWEDIKQFPRITISFVTSGFGLLRRERSRDGKPPVKKP